jgi:tetratricopeptide (TPR) repeat protein
VPGTQASPKLPYTRRPTNLSGGAAECRRCTCLATSRPPDNGEAHYRKALALRPATRHAPPRRPLHLGLGKLYRRTGKREQAREHLATATTMYRRPLHLGLGKLYRRTGKREQAREHLATATTMYRKMGMTYWLEKAKAGDGRGPA